MVVLKFEIICHLLTGTETGLFVFGVEGGFGENWLEKQVKKFFFSALSTHVFNIFMKFSSKLLTGRKKNPAALWLFNELSTKNIGYMKFFLSLYFQLHF